MLLKVTLDSVSFLPEPLRISFLSFTSIVLLLLLEALLRGTNPLVEIIFGRLLSCDRFVLHTTLHILQFVGQIFFFLHYLLVMAVVKDSLTMSELLFHRISHLLYFFIVLKAQFLLEQVFLIVKLASDSCLLIFEHLSESLFD